MSRLLSTGLSKHNGRKFFCERCLQYFYTQDKLNIHDELCRERNNYKVSFPPEQNVTFKNYVNEQRTPFIIYADFECLLKPVNIKNGDNSTRYQKHDAYSAGYYYHCDFDDSSCDTVEVIAGRIARNGLQMSYKIFPIILIQNI